MSNELVSVVDKFLNNKNSFIGFDDFFKDLATFDYSLSEKGIKDSFPPYNIYTKDVNVAAKGEKEMTVPHTFIEVACAGYKKEDLSITYTEDDSILTLECNSSDKSENNKHNYSYKGIAKRYVQRQWKLAKNLKFVQADYTDGILKIEFEPKMASKVEIKSLPIK
nr:MAG TPA: hypothetical protein [Caudoviricetes sp.]